MSAQLREARRRWGRTAYCCTWIEPPRERSFQVGCAPDPAIGQREMCGFGGSWDETFTNAS